MKKSTIIKIVSGVAIGVGATAIIVKFIPTIKEKINNFISDDFEDEDFEDEEYFDYDLDDYDKNNSNSIKLDESKDKNVHIDVN